MTTAYTPNFALAQPDFRSGPWHDLVNGNMAKIDGLIYGALSQANVVPWVNAHAYQVGTTVLDGTDATVWMCAVAHTSAATGTFLADRTAHPTYWARLLTGFAPRGQWAQNTQYFPYDLVYDTGYGIMALCTTKHISTPTGSIKTDSAYWSFLLDMSGVVSVIAAAVSYSNVSSGLTQTNVQTAIDYIQSEVISLNNVNITQGTNISTNANNIATNVSNIGALTTRMSAVEGKNTTQDGRLLALETAPPPSTFPAGTVMLFWQTAAPTGWTKLTTQNDKVLRVVSGSGGVAGGTNTFTSVMAQTVVGNHSITIPEMPPHAHTITTDNSLSAGTGESVIFMPVNGDIATRGSQDTLPQGSGAAHNHAITMAIQYIDVILASKN